MADSRSYDRPSIRKPYACARTFASTFANAVPDAGAHTWTDTRTNASTNELTVIISNELPDTVPYAGAHADYGLLWGLRG